MNYDGTEFDTVQTGGFLKVEVSKDEPEKPLDLTNIPWTPGESLRMILWVGLSLLGWVLVLLFPPMGIGFMICTFVLWIWLPLGRIGRVAKLRQDSMLEQQRLLAAALRRIP